MVWVWTAIGAVILLAALVWRLTRRHARMVDMLVNDANQVVVTAVGTIIISAGTSRWKKFRRAHSESYRRAERIRLEHAVERGKHFLAKQAEERAAAIAAGDAPRESPVATQGGAEVEGGAVG